MEQFSKVLDAVANLLWPGIFVALIIIFRKPVQDILMSAKNRKFTLKIGGTEISMEDFSEQQRRMIADLQEQMIAVRNILKSIKFGNVSAFSSNIIQSGKVRSILWVDDHPENNASLIAHLKELGVNISTELSTESGIKALKREKFDLVITDMGRRENGKTNYEAGLMLTEEIRKIDEEVPIFVFCAPKSEKKYKNRVLGLGASEVTSSSFELLNMISSLGYLPKMNLDGLINEYRGKEQ